MGVTTNFKGSKEGSDKSNTLVANAYLPPLYYENLLNRYLAQK